VESGGSTPLSWVRIERVTTLTESERDALRVEVGLLRLREHRRLFPAELCLGAYADRRITLPLPWPVPGTYDDALLGELTDALWDRWDAPSGATWLLRPGVPDPHDLDVRLTAVTERVAECRGTAPSPFVVVTRYGWVAPRSGESRRWKRLRLLRTDLAAPPCSPRAPLQSTQV
jgi:hypothetical protein